MRGRHTEVVAEGLDDMSEDARDPDIHDDACSRAKHGVRRVVAGPSLTIKVWAMQKQIRQLDSLAGEIRAAGGMWVTRSAMITAFIEAALRSETVLDVGTTQSRRIRKPSLLVRTPPQPEERRAPPPKRLVRMAKYLLRKRSSHFKLEDGV
jgi:hypothetical protein